MAHAGLTAFLLSAMFAGACASASGPPAPAAPPSGPSASAPASFEGARWGTFHSKRFELSLALPDGSAWKIDDHRSPWLRATHDATSSSLVARVWNEDSNVTRTSCYARARGWDAMLPDLDTEALIDDGIRKVLGTEDARVAVGIDARPRSSQGVLGFVVTIVGSVRRCMVFAFQTRAEGQAGGDEIASRLALITERFVPSLKLDQSFAPSRVPLTGAPGAPGELGGAR
jgi:hypothetical protein